MRKRLIKKKVKALSYNALYDLVAYCENKKWVYYGYKEFNKRVN